MRGHMGERDSWELAEGDEIAQGRTVLRLLGGGRRYEAYLVWDEPMLAPMVAKLIRPDQAEEDGGPAWPCAARRTRSRRSRIRSSCAASTPCSTHRTRMCSSSTWRARRCGS